MPLPKRRGYRHYDTKSQTSILSFWSRSALLSLQESNYRHRRAEPKRLKFPCYLFELRADFYLLWAALFTCTALSAQTRKMVAGPEAGRCIHILALPRFFLDGGRIVCRKTRGDIHPIGAGHAIAAGRAGNPERGTKRLGYALIYRLFFRPNGAGQRISGHLHILRKLLSCAHPTEHNRNLRLIPNPPQPPFSRRCRRICRPKRRVHGRRQILRQPAAQQRLHNDHGSPRSCAFCSPLRPA